MPKNFTNKTKQNKTKKSIKWIFRSKFPQALLCFPSLQPVMEGEGKIGETSMKEVIVKGIIITKKLPGLVNWVHNESDLVLSGVNGRSGTDMSCFFSYFNLHWYFASFKGGSLLQMTLDQRVSHQCWCSRIHKQAHISSLSALGSSLHKDLCVE